MSDYKDTLNLPKMDFPMRGDLKRAELDFLGRWIKENYYERMRTARLHQPIFTLHCGPPYANGKLHGGHLVPKLLKDIVVRSKNMVGFDTPYIPGWDSHGLPIEWNVEKNLREQKKSKSDLTIAEFRSLCREYANHWIKDQKSDWQRMGCIADWQNPYITMDFGTEGNIIRELGRVAAKGLLYKDFRPVMWSPVERTALAEAEIEYHDKKSTSAYIKFDLSDRQHEALVAWTTTIWSIPSNQAIAVSEDVEYVELRPTSLGNASKAKIGQIYWVAMDLAEKFAQAINIEAYELGKISTGKSFLGLSCEHPLYKRLVPVVSGHHVTTNEGTGIVHIAPSHGVDDFAIGKKYNLNLECYVDEGGKFSAGIGSLLITGKALEGQSINQAEGLILKELENNGKLLGSETILHSYPVSWRSKAPLICRTTSQWFVAMDKPFTEDGKTLRQRSLEEIDNVNWIPEEGKNRIGSMVSERPDWCISRQRLWGVPIAIFRNNVSGDFVFDQDIFESVAKQIDKHGIDAWETRDTETLLPQGWLEKNGLTTEDLSRETDILDVWFDSGSSYAHVLKMRNDLSFPADLYLEGSDQHRGWFQSSLLLAVATDNRAPYRDVVTHGFVVDENGKKVSKSLGNGADALVLMEKYGADVLRLWVASSDYKTDLRFSDRIMQNVSDNYRKIRNTIRYMIGNLYDFDEGKDGVAYNKLPEMEKWILARYLQTCHEIEDCYDKYNFSKAFHIALNFCVNELSSFYFDVRKDTLYCDLADSLNRRACQTVLSHLFKGIITHLTPLMPFTCDEAWRHTYGDNAPVYTERFSTPDPAWLDIDLLNRWDKIMELRSAVNAMTEAQIHSNGTFNNKSEVRAKIEAPPQVIQAVGDNNLAKIFLCASVEIMPAKQLEISLSRTEDEKCPRCRNFQSLVGEVCGRCSEVMDAKQKLVVPEAQRHVRKNEPPLN